MKKKKAPKKKTHKKKAAKKVSAGDKLKLEHKRFCELYATTREFFGDGVHSYAEAYRTDITQKGGYNNAKVNASKLLTNPNILAYINELLEVVLNEAHVDKQLAFLVTQNADFPTKIAAIREFNALRKRVTQKFEGTVTLAQAVHEAMTKDK